MLRSLWQALTGRRKQTEEAPRRGGHVLVIETAEEIPLGVLLTKFGEELKGNGEFRGTCVWNLLPVSFNASKTPEGEWFQERRGREHICTLKVTGEWLQYSIQNARLPEIRISLPDGRRGKVIEASIPEVIRGNAVNALLEDPSAGPLKDLLSPEPLREALDRLKL
jgi:hypothetical protein